jgi:hypothetical protein
MISMANWPSLRLPPRELSRNRLGHIKGLTNAQNTQILTNHSKTTKLYITSLNKIHQIKTLTISKKLYTYSTDIYSKITKIK